MKRLVRVNTEYYDLDTQRYLSLLVEDLKKISYDNPDAEYTLNDGSSIEVFTMREETDAEHENRIAAMKNLQSNELRSLELRAKSFGYKLEKI